MEDVKVIVSAVTRHGSDEGLEKRRIRIQHRHQYDAEIALLINQTKQKHPISQLYLHCQAAHIIRL